VPSAPPSAVVAIAADLQSAACCALPQQLPEAGLLRIGEQLCCIVSCLVWSAAGGGLRMAVVHTAVVFVPAARAAAICQLDVWQQQMSS
jgi:hypothetical protein